MLGIRRVYSRRTLEGMKHHDLVGLARDLDPTYTAPIGTKKKAVISHIETQQNAQITGWKRPIGEYLDFFHTHRKEHYVAGTAAGISTLLVGGGMYLAWPAEVQQEKEGNQTLNREVSVDGRTFRLTEDGAEEEVSGFSSWNPFNSGFWGINKDLKDVRGKEYQAILGDLGEGEVGYANAGLVRREEGKLYGFSDGRWNDLSAGLVAGPGVDTGAGKVEPKQPAPEKPEDTQPPAPQRPAGFSAWGNGLIDIMEAGEAACWPHVDRVVGSLKGEGDRVIGEFDREVTGMLRDVYDNQGRREKMEQEYRQKANDALQEGLKEGEKSPEQEGN